jgi:hypothetical protein
MKYVDLTGIAFNWTHIADNPFLMQYPGGLSAPVTACVVNGKFGVLYVCGDYYGTTSKGFVLYLFDEHGNICTYQSPDYVNNSPSIVQCCQGFNIFQNNNTFLCTSGWGTYQFVIPNIFTPGATYVVAYPRFAINSPCGSGALQTPIFCSQQKIVAYDFIHPFPDEYDDWASIYDHQGQFLYGGYIGHFLNSEPGFNRISTTLPPNVNNIYSKNGFNFFGNFGDSGGPYQVVGWNQPTLRGNAESLVCGVANKEVYIDTSQVFQNYPNNTDPRQGFANDSSHVALGACDIPGFFCFPDKPYLKILSRDFYVQLNGPNADPNNLFCIVSELKKMFVLSANGIGYNGPVYVADFDPVALGISPVPIVERASYNGLANYHRAVSPSGSFQA